MARGEDARQRPRALSQDVRRARNAVGTIFLLNGFCFASWVSRIPDTRDRLDLTNASLGLLLLALSAGSLLGLPLTGVVVRRSGAARVVLGAAMILAAGLATIGLGVGANDVIAIAVVTVGLFAYGLGTGACDVAMNVEGAAVEHVLARTVMPRFHAGFSFGTVLGAGVGALAAWAAVPVALHLGAVAMLTLLVAPAVVRDFLPRVVEAADGTGGAGSAFGAWREPRTLMIGLMVLALAFTEGTANDWLAVALVDGYDVENWVGVAGFALFVSAMTAGRLVGPVLLDRFGRVAVLWGTLGLSALGLLMIVIGAGPVLAALGIMLWGFGASLGFPVGMSAAADDPVHAAARVSVVSTIGYAAFLAGPPVVGFVADEVGTLNALLLVWVLLLPAALVVPAARRPISR